jgi:long-chain acyl-CoA synthetase
VEKQLFKQVHDALGGSAEIFIAGGAPIDPAIIESFRAMGINMFQGYGMTECAPIIAVNMDNYSKPAAAGLPLPGTRIRIEAQDADGIGEVFCKSDSVMLGYYNDPEATAQVLQDGWLCTGDYGYLDQDGFLYITGRKKNVIVTKNGKNIFPEELESLLQKSDLVQEVMVYGEDDKDGDLKVCADIFPNYALLREQHGALSPERMRDLFDVIVEEVNAQIPSYKRIHRFYLKENDFEKTTTQKIKRHLAVHGAAQEEKKQ